METFVVTPEWKIRLPDKPLYDKQDLKLIETLKAEKQADGWVVTPLGLVVVPYSLMNESMRKEHYSVHWGAENLLKHLQKLIISKNMVESV